VALLLLLGVLLYENFFYFNLKKFRLYGKIFEKTHNVNIYYLIFNI